MSDLYPTPIRLALLRAILRHEDHPQEGVFAVSLMGKAGFDSYEAMVGLGDTKVTSRCDTK